MDPDNIPSPEALLELINGFLERTGMATTTLGMRACQNPHLVARARKAGAADFRLSVAKKVLEIIKSEDCVT